MTSAIARGLICHSGWGHKQFAVNPSHPRKDTANCCAGISIYVYSIFFFPSLSCVLHESIPCGETLCHLTGVVVVAFLSFSFGRSADDVDTEDALHKVKGLQCVFLHLLVCCFITPPHGQLHAVFGGFISFFWRVDAVMRAAYHGRKMVPA